jgi:hypothetical protein
LATDIAEASAMFYEGLEEKGYDQTRLLIQGMGKFQVRDFTDLTIISLHFFPLHSNAHIFSCKQ